MTLLLTTLIMMAFASVYACLLAMLGNRSADLMAALRGQPVHRVQLSGDMAGDAASSRRFSFA